MIDLEQIAYDIGIGKSNDLTRWMLPIATLEEMIALIRKQETALKEQVELNMKLIAINDQPMHLEAPAPAAPVVTVDIPKPLRYYACDLNPTDVVVHLHEVIAHTDAAVAQARAAALAELHPAYEAMQMRAIDAEEKLAAAPQQRHVYDWLPEGWKRAEDGRVIPPAGNVGEAYTIAQAEPLSQPAVAGNAGAAELPPLPEPVYLGGDEAFGDVVKGYTAEHITEAHQQGRAAGLEEAAKLVSELGGGMFTLQEVAAAIRALNKGG